MSKADYEAKIQADGKVVQDAVTKISSSLSSMTQLAKQVSAAEVAAKKAADDLDALNPPSEVAADNDKLVLALRAIDAQLKKLARAAKESDVLAARRPRPRSRARRRSRPASSRRTSRRAQRSARSAAEPLGPRGLGAEQAAQHEREDPAVAEVLALARRVEPDARAELLAVGAHRHLVAPRRSRRR